MTHRYWDCIAKCSSYDSYKRQKWKEEIGTDIYGHLCHARHGALYHPGIPLSFSLNQKPTKSMLLFTDFIVEGTEAQRG
jgi:hypothetical protein